MKFSGIDLHSNNSVVVVSDEEDRIVYQKRLPNNLEQIRAALAPYRDELAGVVVESTYNWLRRESNASGTHASQPTVQTNPCLTRVAVSPAGPGLL